MLLVTFAAQVRRARHRRYRCRRIDRVSRPTATKAAKAVAGFGRRNRLGIVNLTTRTSPGRLDSYILTSPRSEVQRCLPSIPISSTTPMREST